ncbi:DNA-binding LytR/AlgR family response regulator [Sedimentibacter acidaminivorans]|jgi:DNA-binding LytR/AlgR family response regulator|uniref:DNA-binding LytR/AlgR family response regulator n=1 Tax=Sedimentibacter acidaminivorans TaxID=913099 RepID=A0ABS4GDB7_9FIRM|nr:LytTR family DNA-binding domain-containing protein [Sedimentibacter acidaminivorans]MBP1925637.1 DNA-binding LytR/AlgR family response regulator [Sedimentibacter acidaminivorans]
MITIGIYADSIDRKKISIAVIQFLKENQIEGKVSYIRKSHEILNVFDQHCKYNIIIISKNNELTYIKRNSSHYVKKSLQLTTGLLVSPLNSENLGEIIISENNYNCPHGFYKIDTNKTMRLVPYKDIEYFHWSEGKSILYLTNNETEDISNTVKRIKTELSEDYFVECARGYIVNLYNVKKIDKINQEITLKSENKIPINRKKFQHTFKMLIKDIYGMEL